ncbi:hypothetical protein DFH08DRAFT_796508 [Mycena albidolilacea]|uniref:Uncharacterized protein n=1 Tax=Mycena albidolilacea TaxID=1033008 RepID=A0AAD7AV37_9AGAR|nr:hypothetical protein DFH08DRAFT_796508 [Mycena albidolilacea]
MSKGKWLASAMCMVVFKQLESKSRNVNDRIESMTQDYGSLWWIYCLMVSEDANFKMKGRDRSSQVKDPTLGPGWAYMVASNKYLSYLVKHIHEDEISHCVSFAALVSKQQVHQGPAGIGGWFCELLTARSVLAIGNWGSPEGEWCGMPESMHLPDWVQIIFKVPKFHLPPHIKKCYSPYSFNYTKGVGRTDGEGVECDWSWLNLMARSVLAMGPGAQEDTIDDLCGFSNWKKTVMIHSCTFHLFTKGLQEGHEEDLTKWERKVREWEMDSGGGESPYEYAEVKATTMADVLAQLAVEEHATLVCDGVSALVVKLGPFLIAGIEIQQSQ